MRNLFLTLAAVLCCTAQAQTFGKLFDKAKALQQHLDSTAIRKVDTCYIAVPKQPWRVILRTKLSDIDVSSDNTSALVDDVSSRLKLDFDTRPGVSTGFWVGYRGLGFGYFYKLSKNGGTNFSFSSTGAKYGVNMRLHNLHVSKTHMLLEMKGEDREEVVADRDAMFLEPIDVTSFYLNSYYVFNGRRYSQAAAYNQSVVQRRSAGSLLVGATLFTSVVDMAKPINALVLQIADCPGRISLGQINIGVGYGYNWVPAKGWIVNVMAMPTLSIYDRVKLAKFTSNYGIWDAVLNPTEVDNYGEWNAETRRWANGVEQKPLLIDGKEVEGWKENVELWETGNDNSVSALKLNADVRLGVAYCWDRYFVGANGQINHFRYGREDSRVFVTDWYTRVSFGVRF